MRINVRDETGPNCLTMDDGERIYGLVHPCLRAGDSVELDFEGVQLVASPFFNAAVGQLLRDMTAAELRRRVRFTDLSPAGQHVLGRVIENSAQFYASDATTQRADDEALQGGDDD